LLFIIFVVIITYLLITVMLLQKYSHSNVLFKTQYFVNFQQLLLLLSAL